jgi:hypothetical protein
MKLPILAGALLASILGPAAVAAQAASPAVPPDSGLFIIRHAGDTVATERFTRTPTQLQGTLILRNGKNTAQGYLVAVAPDASVPLIEVVVREDLDSGRVKGKVVQRARVIFKEDSAAVDDVTNNGLVTRVFGTEKGAIPYLNLSFALLEQAVRRARNSSPPASTVPFFSLGGGETADGKLTPIGTDSLNLAIGNVEFHLRVDPAGRVLGGRIPGQGVEVERR